MQYSARNIFDSTLFRKEVLSAELRCFKKNLSRSTFLQRQFSLLPEIVFLSAAPALVVDDNF